MTQHRKLKCGGEGTLNMCFADRNCDRNNLLLILTLPDILDGRQ